MFLLFEGSYLFTVLLVSQSTSTQINITFLFLLMNYAWPEP